MLLPDLPLAAAKAFTLAQLTVCPPPSSVPDVQIYFLNQKPVYVTDRTVREITAEMHGRQDPVFDQGGVWQSLAMTMSDIKSATKVQYSGIHDSAGNMCLGVASVDFIINYQPTVFIARELADLPCKSKMVKLHEEHHVALDLKTIKEYIPKIKMEILWSLRDIGLRGPFPESAAQGESKAIFSEVEKSIVPPFDKLNKVRIDRGRLLDSPGHYMQEQKLCPSDMPLMQSTLGGGTAPGMN